MTELEAPPHSDWTAETAPATGTRGTDLIGWVVHTHTHCGGLDEASN